MLVLHENPTWITQPDDAILNAAPTCAVAEARASTTLHGSGAHEIYILNPTLAEAVCRDKYAEEGEPTHVLTMASCVGGNSPW